MTWIGASPIRPDADAKIRGRAMYAFDLAIDGMLFARVLRSPVPAGRILSLDTRRAREMPGVRAVVTAADVPATLAGEFLLDTPLFARDTVRYVGEPIAAVAADTLEAAKLAAAAIVLEVATRPAVTTLDEALAPGAPLVHPDAATYATQYGLPFSCEGNLVAQLVLAPDGVDEGFAKAYRVVEDTIEGQRQYQGYLESRNAVATYTDERLEVHVGHQHSSALRERLAQFFALDVERVRILGYTIGGGFGGKLEFGPEPYAAALSRAAGGRPVKLVFDRSEDLGVATCRENSRVRLRSAIDAAGNVLARKIDVLLDNGAYMMDQALSPSLAAYIGAANYHCGPLRARAALVFTNTPPTGAMRGVAGVILTAALEKHVDHICRVVGRDRRAYRVERLLQNGHVMPSGQVLDDAHILSEAFAAVEASANWEEARERARVTPLRGIGIAAVIWCVNPSPGYVKLRLIEDGRVEVVTGANDNGSGPLATGIRQIVAEVLGISVFSIDVPALDTSTSGYDGGSQGSRTTQVAGEAARRAAVELRNRLAQAVASQLGANVEQLWFSDGQIVNLEHPLNSVSLIEAARQAQMGGLSLTAEASFATPPVACTPVSASGLLIPFFPTPTYHVHFCEVDVDPVTGNVHVRRYVVCQEVGRVLNPREIYGQIQGAVTQGIGYALYESLRLREGRYVEQSLEAYRLPLALDIPRVEVITLEHAAIDGPFGAKGVGEPPIIPVPAVLLNAIADAVGESFDSLPITPQDVLAALSRRTL